MQEISHLPVLMGMKSESQSIVSDSLGSHGLYSPWNAPGQNTGAGSLSLLQGIFPTQGSNPGHPHCSQSVFPCLVLLFLDLHISFSGGMSGDNRISTIIKETLRG